MRKPRRRWEERAEDDPLTGLVNLFDLWMVFSIALLIVFAGAARRREDPRPAGTPGDVATRKARPIETYRVSDEELDASGERLGVAYRLPSGEVVCVPEPRGAIPGRAGRP